MEKIGLHPCSVEHPAIRAEKEKLNEEFYCTLELIWIVYYSRSNG
jgi:hypothetical protein